MKYLSLCFIGEGPTDRSLARLGMRATEALLAKSGTEPVDVGPPDIVRPGSRELDNIVRAAAESLCFHDLLLVHADGKGDPDRAFRERIRPVFERLREDPSVKGRCFVGVVPVHETEAWLLADGKALRDALGTRLPLRELGVPERPGDIEALADAKAVLRDAQVRARGGRQRSRRGLEVPYEVLADTVGLESLRQLSAFRRFERDLHDGLAALRLARPRAA